jgi:hypothetical protein
MATTGTQTVRDVVKAALRKARVTGFGEAPDADDAEVAMDELNFMLKGWQNRRYNLWTKTAGSLALTTAAVYTLDPVRPLRILSARFKRNGIEVPMQRMTRDEYDELPNKATTGQPTQFYYDRQREAARFYVWPVLATAAGETIEYTYDRELEDVTSLDDTLDMPGEWWDAVVYGLAVRMLETLNMPAPQTLILRAEYLLETALADDREGSVFFGTPERWG